MTANNTPNSGAVKTPAGNPPARITDTLNGEPLTGRRGEDVLGQAIEHAFLPPDSPQPRSAERQPGGPGPDGGDAGGAPRQPDKTLPPDKTGGDTPPGSETPEQKAAREAAQAEALAQRAQERGVTVEQQQADEAAETARLEEIAQRTGETYEEIYAREDKGKAEPAPKQPAKTFTQEQVDARVQEVVAKRLKTANEEIARLKAQVAEGGQAGAANPLLGVKDAGQLEELRRAAAGRVRDAESKLTQLTYAPQRVEKFFRELVARTPALGQLFSKDGQEDFSVERMADVLEAQKQRDSDLLDAVPQQQRLLELREQNGRAMREPEVLKVAAFIEDADSEEHAMFDRLVQTLPAVPNIEYWAAAAVLGLRQLEPALEAMRARRNGKAPPAGNGARRNTAFVPRVKFPQGGSRGGGLPPARNGDRTKSLIEELRRTGSEASLDKLLGALPGVVNDLS